jgi:hypothetical protein
MFKLPPIRDIVLDAFLTFYASAPFLGHYWAEWRGGLNANVSLALIGLMAAGLIGTLLWCNDYLPSEVMKVRRTLILFMILSVPAVIALCFLVLR